MGDMLGSWSGASAVAYADPIGGATQFVFFQTINDFLRKEIDIFQWNLLQQTTLWIGSIALLVLTIWILIHGYRIVTGQSREPMMALVGDSLQAALVIFLATSMAAGSSQLFWTLTDGMSNAVTSLVSGNSSPFQSIDNNLAAMQLSMSTIDALDAGGDKATEDAKTRAMWFTGIGVAGPGVVAGAMLLLNKIALALFIGLGPLFIMTLLFRQTRSFFSRWLFYGIGTVFSLGVLSVMVGIAMKMVGAVTVAFIAKYYTSMAMGGTPTDGINSMALQQGGLGMLLSVLIIMAPPIAAAFFQGTLANFQTYSPFGQIGRGTEGGHARSYGLQPGMPGYLPPPNHSQSITEANSAPFGNHASSGLRSAYAPPSNNKYIS